MTVEELKKLHEAAEFDSATSRDVAIAMNASYRWMPEVLRRLEAADKDRDYLKAKNAAMEDWLMEWARYLSTTVSSNEENRKRLLSDLQSRFFGGEFDSLKWLSDRDSSIKKAGAESAFSEMRRQADEVGQASGLAAKFCKMFADECIERAEKI